MFGNADMLEKAGIMGLILAGGRSHRFGERDKCFEQLGGTTLIRSVQMRAKDQVNFLAISANQDARFFADLDMPVIPDSIEGYAGPLAGLLSGLEWLAGKADYNTQYQWIATFPVDSPFFPDDLIAALLDAAAARSVPAFAATCEREHPAFGLWPVGIKEELRHFITSPVRHGLLDFAASVDARTVVFQDGKPDPFFNINTPEDLAHANEFLSVSERGGRDENDQSGADGCN